jgi:hypothetical protein
MTCQEPPCFAVTCINLLVARQNSRLITVLFGYRYIITLRPTIIKLTYSILLQVIVVVIYAAKKSARGTASKPILFGFQLLQPSQAALKETSKILIFKAQPQLSCALAAVQHLAARVKLLRVITNNVDDAIDSIINPSARDNVSTEEDEFLK